MILVSEWLRGNGLLPVNELLQEDASLQGRRLFPERWWSLEPRLSLGPDSTPGNGWNPTP
ncbi:hypothetical protein [Desulfonatronum thiodismutans]|uniref:hypothetical protein n=1 Tax=Desulfonatronum thiodismutans TaxID=159290 RepID=UPI00126865D8|nr:hypothetical protein [Desulfonatronum thiodismutans]